MSPHPKFRFFLLRGNLGQQKGIFPVFREFPGPGASLTGTSELPALQTGRGPRSPMSLLGTGPQNPHGILPGLWWWPCPAVPSVTRAVSRLWGPSPIPKSKLPPKSPKNAAPNQTPNPTGKGGIGASRAGSWSCGGFVSFLNFFLIRFFFSFRGGGGEKKNKKKKASRAGGGLHIQDYVNPAPPRARRDPRSLPALPGVGNGLREKIWGLSHPPGVPSLFCPPSSPSLSPGLSAGSSR